MPFEEISDQQDIEEQEEESPEEEPLPDHPVAPEGNERWVYVANYHKDGMWLPVGGYPVHASGYSLHWRVPALRVTSTGTGI
jgi:hypothetical protein